MSEFQPECEWLAKLNNGQKSIVEYMILEGLIERQKNLFEYNNETIEASYQVANSYYDNEDYLSDEEKTIVEGLRERAGRLTEDNKKIKIQLAKLKASYSKARDSALYHDETDEDKILATIDYIVDRAVENQLLPDFSEGIAKFATHEKIDDEMIVGDGFISVGYHMTENGLDKNKIEVSAPDIESESIQNFVLSK